MTLGQAREAHSNRLSPASHPGFRVTTWHEWRPESEAAGYGLSLASVAVALGLAQAFVYFELPLPFAAFALCASDTGTGLPPQHADQIFKAFTTKSHGTGMGLSISRSIVESHGGQLWAAPNSPLGARFHITLPTIVEANESTGGRSHGLHH
jgi:signal transduction histidine kinase